MATSETITLNETNQKGGSWFFLAAIILIGLCALIAVIVSSVALTKATKSDITISTLPVVYSDADNNSDDVSDILSNTKQSSDTERRVYNIARGHDWGAQEYFDDRGYIAGFSQDLIFAVCKEAGIDCRVIWDEYTNCWDSEPGGHPFGGPALLGRWYDACTGWSKTVERIHVFDFSVPFLSTSPVHFYKKPGTSFNPNDIREKTIGFFDGWAYDEKCLARHSSDNNKGYVLQLEQVKYVATPQDMLTVVQSGEVDAFLATEADAESFVKIGLVESAAEVELNCVLSGGAMMTRKDNNFVSHWNRGFIKLQAKGKFKEICENSVDSHGHKGKINCV